jgi:SEC-C motif domain protein
MSQCPCQSGKEYEACCGPIIGGSQAASTAEALMRSRYTAFVKSEIDYLKNSLHPDHRDDFDPVSTRDLADNSEWINLQIINTSGGGKDDQEGTVEFIVTFSRQGVTYKHHELAQFNRHNGTWYYTDGELVMPDGVR